MPDEFVFQWEVDEVSKLKDDGRNSPIHYHCSVPWYLYVRTETSERTNNIAHLGLYLMCNYESDCELWSIENESILRVVNRNQLEKSSTAMIVRPFCKEYNECGKSALIELTTLLNENEGFVREDKIIVEARIKVTSAKFIRKIPKLDFSQPSADADNVALMLDDGTVHVCRKQLSKYSPYFTTLFFGKFKEKNQNEIKLEDVKTEDFIELLHVVYPSHRPINAWSYALILPLADRFEVEYATYKVQEYLMKSNKVEIETKLLLADQYRLETLKAQCLKSLKTAKEIKELKNTPEFAKMSDSLKASLLVMICDFI